MNEAFGDALPPKGQRVPTPESLLSMGTALLDMCGRLDPGRPTIRNSGPPFEDDLSGDSHNYRGSLASGEFLDIHGTAEPLNTEFGFDAPPAPDQLKALERLSRRLEKVLPDIERLHDYQYYLLKYYIEHYRMQKHAPCGGHFQFMWIDLCPQSFYGVYDFWGRAKSLGLGGGLRAMRESNQPIGIFMEFKDAPIALHAVNDLPRDLGPCRASWRVLDGDAAVVDQGEALSPVGPDSHARICDLAFAPLKLCTVQLRLEGADGLLLAENTYVNPFDMPRRPKDYPERFDAELGMRTYGR